MSVQCRVSALVTRCSVALGRQVNRYHIAARSAIKGIYFRRTNGL